MKKNNKRTLCSPDGLPSGFTITITEAENSSTRTFEVTESNPASKAKKPFVYSVQKGDHKSYIGFFHSIAQNFGARPPQNSQPARENTFKAQYHKLLDRNLAPGMLYGYGDPAALRVENGADGNDAWYYVVSTSNDAPDSFPIIRSRNLTDWEFVGFVFPQGRKPEWAADGEHISDYWAPEMHRIGDEFRVYFVARDKITRELCIGMAKSSRPGGTFIAEKEPILKENVIDPHVFVENDETAYFYWKKDNNEIFPVRLNDLLAKHPDFIEELFSEKEDRITASFIQTLWSWARNLEPMERFLIQQTMIEAVTCSFSGFEKRLADLSDRQSDVNIKNSINAVLRVMKTPMYAQRLSPGGSSLAGRRRKILENDREWEAHLVEGMWVAKHELKYYLFYAGNDFSTNRYGIGVAVGNSPLGPYKKMSEPLLRSTKDWSGPGHPSVVRDPNGKPLLLLHAYRPGKMGYKEFRVLLAASISFEGDRVLLRETVDKFG